MCLTAVSGRAMSDCSSEAPRVVCLTAVSGCAMSDCSPEAPMSCA